MKKFYLVLSCQAGARSQNGVPQVGVNSYWPTKQEAIDQMKRAMSANSKSGANYDWYIAEGTVAALVPVPNVEIVELKD